MSPKLLSFLLPATGFNAALEFLRDLLLLRPKQPKAFVFFLSFLGVDGSIVRFLGTAGASLFCGKGFRKSICISSISAYSGISSIPENRALSGFVTSSSFTSSSRLHTSALVSSALMSGCT